jgi:signal transduction histidine kinase
VAGYGGTPEEEVVARRTKISPAMIEVLLARLEHDDVAAIHTVPPELLSPDERRQLAVHTPLCMPLRRGGEMIGILTARRRQGPPFGARQERIAKGISQLASLALTNARLVEELDRANRLKSDFVATMSHELRTPLNVIMGYTDLLFDGQFEPVGRAQHKPLRRIQESAHQLLELINSMLDLGRLEAGKLPIEPQDVRLPDLIAELEARTPDRWQKEGVRLEWRLAPDLPVIQTDPIQLKVVLMNLIDNAFKFTDEGGVTVEARPDTGGVEISVSDTGIGISPETLPIIFEYFRQGEQAMTRRFGGVGLGLYIVRRLLGMLGGSVSVESEVGRGSTFRVRLPPRAVTNEAAR